MDANPTPVKVNPKKENDLGDLINLGFGEEEHQTTAPLNDLLNLGGDIITQEPDNLLGGDLLDLNPPAPVVQNTTPLDQNLLGGDLLDLNPPAPIVQNTTPLDQNLLGGDLLDLSSPVSQPSSMNTGEFNLMDLGVQSTPENLLGGLGAPVNNTQQPNLLGDDDLFGGLEEAPTSASFTETITGHEDENIKLLLNLQKTDLNTTSINVQFINKTSSTLTNVKLLVAVTKHLSMTLHPASGTILQANSNGGITQVKFPLMSYLVCRCC